MSILFFLIANIFVCFNGLFGIICVTRNILIVIMSIELVLLSVNMNFLVFSYYLDDMLGQLFALFVLTIAAAESAIGLAILILYYRNRGDISIENIAVIKG